MGRSKLDKFRDNQQRDNVLEPGKPIFKSIKGNWQKQQFNNQNPLVLELACGKGDFAVGLARLFPDINFIGVDIKGSRLWTGSSAADREGLKNVAFLRTHILGLENFFEVHEVHAIWITFPDPRPREKDTRRRLTYPRFLEIYRKIIKPGGWVYLKTDNEKLFRYTLDTLSSIEWIKNLTWTENLYASELKDDHYGLKTNYELRFIEEGLTIKYMKFQIY